MKQGNLTAAALKRIAAVVMLIDHAAIAFLSPEAGSALLTAGGTLSRTDIIYLVMRLIGRMAFPLYAFFLAEGFMRTRDAKAYLKRLLILALISEVPFDLLNTGRPFDPSAQNTVFTLAVSLAAIMFTDRMAIRPEDSPSVRSAKTLRMMAVTAAAGIVSGLLRFDYGVLGPVLPVIFYWFRCDQVSRNVLAAGTMLWGGQSAGILSLIPITFYSGEKGRQSRYGFYIFYPLHLAVLAAAAFFIKRAGA